MKRNLMLLVLAGGLIALLPAAAGVGKWLFDDRRNVIPYALCAVAALAVLLAVALDALRWAAGTRRRR